MPFVLEQSHSEIYASAGGLAVVGRIINRHSGLKKRLKSVPLRHGIAHIDLVRTYLGLLCQGKNDFEAVEGIRDDLYFRQALGIARVPSSARLRQRFDEQAVALIEAGDDCLVPLLSNLKAPYTQPPVPRLFGSDENFPAWHVSQISVLTPSPAPNSAKISRSQSVGIFDPVVPASDMTRLVPSTGAFVSTAGSVEPGGVPTTLSVAMYPVPVLKSSMIKVA